MKKRIVIFFAAVLALLVLAGCSKEKEVLPETDDTEEISDTEPETETETEVTLPDEPEQAPETETEPEPDEETSPDDDVIIEMISTEEIKNELYTAITQLKQPAIMEVSSAGLGEKPELDIKNIYYKITAENPELKYAYDVSAEMEGDILRCRISYMPYKTGQMTEGGIEVSSLEELIDVAENNLGAEPTAISITDPSLSPDEMNRALQQAGGGYIMCQLNLDATAITYSPPVGMTIEECLEVLSEADKLADEVIAQVITDDMTEWEKAESLFSYVTENVKYDQRYYSDRENMPYESQTALGALRDNIAMCGGYSHAVKLLFEKVGILCYNVTGKYFSEYHMWNTARLDGEWLWFDATAGRGSSMEFGLRHFAEETLDETQYKWDSEVFKPLLK